MSPVVRHAIATQGEFTVTRGDLEQLRVRAATKAHYTTPEARRRLGYDWPGRCVPWPPWPATTATGTVPVHSGFLGPPK